MEELVVTGKMKEVGVSNFSKSEVETLFREGSTVPALTKSSANPGYSRANSRSGFKAKECMSSSILHPEIRTGFMILGRIWRSRW
jgi:diketogulonate reductase-like aldo/keto reductase